MEETVIKVEGISKAFNGNKVLHNISFELREGDLLIVQGANGSGKTTLLKICAGLLSPTAGAVSYYRPFWRERKAPVSFLSHSVGMYSALTPFENLQLFTDSSCTVDKIKEELEYWGIHRQQSFPLAGLSAGEARKAALAGIFLNPLPLVLLDEPASNLDKASREKLICRIGELLSSPWRGAFLIATHEDFLLSALKAKSKILRL